MADKNGHAVSYSGGTPLPQVAVPQTEAQAEAALTGQPMALSYRATIPIMSYYGAGGVPVLNQTLWADVENMLTHPAVSGPLGYYKAGIANVEFEIKTKRSDVGEYVHHMIRRFWERSLAQGQRSYEYGWMAGEICYREENALLCYESLFDFYPLDVYALTHKNRYCGAAIHNIQGGAGTGLYDGGAQGVLRLWGPYKYPAKVFWYAHNKRYQRFYGQSQLYAAWRPWRRLAFRDGAEESLDGGFYRYLYAGWEVWFPPEDFAKADGGVDYTAARNMARQFTEQAKAGVGLAIPNIYDANGNPKWVFKKPEAIVNFDPAVNVIKYLETAISKGIGVPPELQEAADTGSGWSGRKVPLIGFYTAQLANARGLVSAWKQQIGDPLVRWNFGPGISYEIEVKLVLPAELAGQDNKQGQAGSMQGAGQAPPGREPGPPGAQQPAKEPAPKPPGTPRRDEGQTLSTEGSESLAEQVQRAAQETEPNPSEAQKKSGNYKKGRVTIQGLPIVIENARGSTRSGTDAKGKPWSVQMAHHYGYVGKSDSKADGDAVDVFVGPEPESEIVYVVNQKKPDGSFDEHKAMLGFHNEDAAKDGYLGCYSLGWKGMGEVTPMTMSQFKEWLRSGHTGKPTPGQTITLSLADEEPSDQLASDAAEEVLHAAMAAFARLSGRIRRELVAAIRRAPRGSHVIVARRILGKWLPRIVAALTDTQLAAALVGMREIARRLEIKEAQSQLPPGSQPHAEPWRPEPLALPPSGEEEQPEAPRLHLPLIDAAVADLRRRRLLTRDDFDALAAEARQKAFTVAGVESEKALETIRDALAQAVDEGQTQEQFVQKASTAVGDTFLSPLHAETVFRTSVNTAYSNAQQELLDHPLVTDLFPYAAYYAIHDDRVREEHLGMETRGIQGTNIYRRDDPVFQLFRPPWDYCCRCGWRAVSVREAARLGIEEAQRWLATGQPPLRPHHVEMPPWSPRDGFQRIELGTENDGQADILDAEHLACAYAELWNGIEKHGGTISPDELQAADDELCGSDWHLVKVGTKPWVVLHAQKLEGIELATERAPKGGVVINGQFYRGGLFIPKNAVEQMTPEQKQKLHEAQEAQRQKRQARGPVDVAKLRERTQGHGSLNAGEERAAEGRLRALQAHHGELTAHRLEELTDQAHRLLEKSKGDKVLEGRARRELAQLHHMAGKVHEAAAPKQTAPAEPASQSTKVKTLDGTLAGSEADAFDPSSALAASQASRPGASTSDRLSALGGVDSALLDELDASGDARRAGIGHNEVFRSIDKTWQDYERSAKGARDQREIASALANEKKRIQEQIVPGLRKLAKEGVKVRGITGKPIDLKKAAGFYEKHGVGVIEALESQLEAGGSADAAGLTQAQQKQTHQKAKIDAALSRFANRAQTAQGGGIFGGEDLQAREGFAKLPDQAPIVFTEGEFQGKTGRIVHDTDPTTGEPRIVAEVDGRKGLVPVSPDAIEPLDTHLSWRVEGGGLGAGGKQGGLFAGAAPRTNPQPEEEHPDVAAQRAIRAQLNAVARSGKPGAVEGVAVEPAGVGQFQATIGGKSVKGDLNFIAARVHEAAKLAEAENSQSSSQTPLTSPKGETTISSGGGNESPKEAPKPEEPKMTTRVNGNPLNEVERKSREKAYRDTIADFSGPQKGQVEQMNLTSAIKDGLFGGISPEKIKSDLKALGVDPERVDRLVDRNVSQWKFTYEPSN